ncbi:MAG: serine/threonine protein kinase [Candidatus Obscuribacterales bacterium]|nr:serine/threonine protein kinase [Candidatus Obscuribacterales bacterium]
MQNLHRGDVIESRFVIIDLIGEGGMASVYSATQEGLDRQIAIKTLHLTHLCSDEEKRRFLREGLILSKLSHPNIPIFYHVGLIDQSMPFMAIELLRGRSLRAKLNEAGKLGWKETVQLAIQILSALECAHTSGIVHRDIKPDNVFLAEPGETVKVIDFGLSTFSDVRTSQRITQTGLLLGSVYYMSPEQCRGEQVTYAADLYALGCLMFECLAGEPLFDCDNPIGLLHKHANERPRKLASLDVVVPDTVQSIIDKALAKSVSDRFPSAEAMATALKENLLVEAADFPSMPPSRALVSSKHLVLYLLLTFSALASLIIAIGSNSINAAFSDALRRRPEQAVVLADFLSLLNFRDSALNVLLLASPSLERLQTPESVYDQLRAANLFSKLAEQVPDKTRVACNTAAFALIGATENRAGRIGRQLLHSYCLLAASIEDASCEKLFAVMSPMIRQLVLDGHEDCSRVLSIRLLKSSFLSPESRSSLCLHMGAMETRFANTAQGKVWFDEAVKLSAVKYPKQKERAVRSAAIAALERNDLSSAESYCQELLELNDRFDYPIICQVMILAQLSKGDYTTADAFVNLIPKLNSLSSGEMRAALLCSAIFTKMSRGDSTEARSLSKQLFSMVRLQQNQESQLPRLVAASVAVQEADFDEARRVIDNVVSYTVQITFEKSLLQLLIGEPVDIARLQALIQDDNSRINFRILLKQIKKNFGSNVVNSAAEWKRTVASLDKRQLMKSSPLWPSSEIARDLVTLKVDNTLETRKHARSTFKEIVAGGVYKPISSLLPLLIPKIINDQSVDRAGAKSTSEALLSELERKLDSIPGGAR